MAGLPIAPARTRGQFEYLADPSLYPYIAGPRKAASRPWFNSAPQALGTPTNLFQYCFQTSQFFRARVGKDFSNFGSVSAKKWHDQFFAFWCERYDADATVFRTLDSAYQSLIEEAVDSHADRAGRKVHFWAERIQRYFEAAWKALAHISQQ
jgi:hypothetical protein